jgi:hypothetical protein
MDKAVGNVGYRDNNTINLWVCFWEMKGDALANQLITLTRSLDEALPVKDCDLPTATLDQSRVFQLAGHICDGRPLGP